MKTYPAPWGKLLIGLSALSTLICVGVSVVMLATADRGPDDPRVIRAAAVLPVLIVAVAALFSVRGYEVTPDEIVVQRPLRSNRFERARLQSVAIDPEALRGDAAVLRSAASIFRLNCAACHGEDAGGQAKTFPDLTDREWQWGGEAAQLEQTITAGRQAVMPGWQAALGDAGVSAVADYVISLSRVEPGRLGLAEGKRLFGLYCTACHGADGSGNAALGAPPLNDGSWLYGGSTLDVRKSIATGRNGVMPPFGERLEPAQIRMLVGLLEQQRIEASE